MQKYYMPSPRFPNPVRHSQNPSGQIIFSGFINTIDMTFTLCNWRLKPSVLSGLNVLLTSRIWKLGLEIKSKWPIIIDIVYINNRTWLIHWLSDWFINAHTKPLKLWYWILGELQPWSGGAHQCWVCGHSTRRVRKVNKYGAICIGRTKWGVNGKNHKDNY